MSAYDGTSSVLDTRSTSGVEIYKIRYVKFFSEKKFQDRNIERGRDSHGKCIVPTRYYSSKVAFEYIENVQKVSLFENIILAIFLSCKSFELETLDFCFVKLFNF